MEKFFQVLEEKDLDYLKHKFKHNSIEWKSIYYNFLSKKVYPHVAPLIPSFISPNAVTFLGTLVCCLFGIYVLIFYGDMDNENVSSFFFYLSAIVWRLNYHLDALDGVVARYRKKKSVLGEVLDHGLDSINLAMILLAVVVLGAWKGHPYSLLILTIGFVAKAVFTIQQKYMSYETSEIDFLNEVMLVISFVLAIFGFLGHENVIGPFRFGAHFLIVIVFGLMFRDLYLVFKELGWKKSAMEISNYVLVWVVFLYWSITQHSIAKYRCRFMLLGYIFHNNLLDIYNLLNYLYGKKFVLFRWYSVPLIVLFVMSVLGINETLVTYLYVFWSVAVGAFYVYVWYEMISKTAKHFGINVVFY